MEQLAGVVEEQPGTVEAVVGQLAEELSEAGISVVVVEEQPGTAVAVV